MRKKVVARIICLLVLLTVGLISCQGLFVLLQRQGSQTTEQSLRALLRTDRSFEDTLALARQVDDLEALGLLRCAMLVRLEPDKTVFIDNTTRDADCVLTNTSLLGVHRSIDIKSISGAPWRIGFVANNHPSFYLSLWLARLFLSTSIITAFLVYWLRIDHRENALLREEKNNRTLEKRIQVQSESIATMMIEAAVQASLSELALQVSHDIRSPLSALNFLVSSLTEISTEKKNFISQIASRINDISNDLLARYKIGDSNLSTAPIKLLLKPEPIEVILRQVCEEKSIVLIERPGLSFRFDFSTSDRKIVLINEREFCRVISNLLNNAVDAVGEIGSVSLAVTTEGDEVAVVICDTGHGIPEAILDKLGRERVTFGKASGSGLGVFHARAMIEAMHGKFEISSQLGKGTIITLRFPSVAESCRRQDSPYCGILTPHDAI